MIFLNALPPCVRPCGSRRSGRTSPPRTLAAGQGSHWAASVGLSGQQTRSHPINIKKYQPSTFYKTPFRFTRKMNYTGSNWQDCIFEYQNDKETPTG